MKKNNGRETRPTEIDFTEGSTSDLAAELVVAANDAFHVSKVLEEYTAARRREERNKSHTSRELLL
jgi:hypothetical protein